MLRPLQIDAYFDLVCPWCLIGKRHLDMALAEFAERYPEVQVRLRWRPVQLIPGIPDEGVDFLDFYLRRLGNPAALHQRQALVREAAARANVHIHFENIRRFPNTRRAHQLLAYAQQHGAPARLGAMLDELFLAYFQNGQDLGCTEALLAIGSRHGLDRQALACWLASGQGVPEPVEVTGVPFYVFNRLHAVSGAQAPAALLDTMLRAMPHGAVAAFA